MVGKIPKRLNLNFWKHIHEIRQINIYRASRRNVAVDTGVRFKVRSVKVKFQLEFASSAFKVGPVHSVGTVACDDVRVESRRRKR